MGPIAERLLAKEDVPRRVFAHLRGFLSRSMREKYVSLALRWRRWFPQTPIPLRLRFGVWWVAENSALDHALFGGSFESAQMRFVERFLQPGMTVVDIGAHHGLYTMLASKRVGRAGKVIAFEPSPRERRRLRRHIRLNECSNVSIEPAALGSDSKEADFFIVLGTEDWCNSLRPPSVTAETQTTLVAVVPLDEYLLRMSLPRVDFIKLDAEGAELEVFKGATQLLQTRPRPVVLCEVAQIRTEPWGYSAEEIIEFLRGLDYEWFEVLADGMLVKMRVANDLRDTNLIAVPRERLEEVSRLTY